MREIGGLVLSISALEVLGAVFVVLVGLLLFGVEPVIALMLAGITPASAAAAVNNVVEELTAIGGVGIAYIALRAAGLIVGAFAGGALAGTPHPMRRWLGLAIIPQASVALGMALIAGNNFPELRHTILSLAIGSAVVFELTGPALTRRGGRSRQRSITRSREARIARQIVINDKPGQCLFRPGMALRTQAFGRVQSAGEQVKFPCQTVVAITQRRTADATR